MDLNERPSKRPKLDSLHETVEVSPLEDASASLTKPISPPRTEAEPSNSARATLRPGRADGSLSELTDHQPTTVSSPIQLSRVEGLPPTNNIDTVSLHDIVGDPLIKECWAFNYLFDVDFLR